MLKAYFSHIIDKTKNIREHIFTFFSKKPTEKHKQQLHQEVADISFELTGNELIATLVETSEIKKLAPKFNRPVANAFYKYGLFSETDQNGFQKLMVKVLDENENPLLKFSSKFKAEKMNNYILKDYETAKEIAMDYVHMYYNSRRPHSSLNGLTPLEKRYTA